MMAQRLRVTAAAIAVAAVTLAGCGSPAGDGGSSRSAAPSGDGITSDEAAPSQTSLDSTSPTASAPGSDTSSPEDSAPPSAPSTSSSPAADAVDALTLTGPAEAQDVPDMEPIVTGVSPRLPATVTDSRGETITITTADRVIALDLYGTLADTVIALGLQDRLVGRGVSDTQESLKDLPVVSQNGIDLNVEAVLSLHPDVILTNLTIGSVQRYEQLESAGVTVVRFEQEPSIAAIPTELHQVGAVFGMAAEADQVAEHTEQQFTEARAEIARLRAATPRPPRAIVAYVRGSAGLFFILGAGYGASDVLHELGLEDVAANAGIDNMTPANAESLVKLDPEIVLTMKVGVASGGGIDAFLARPGMSATTAGQHRRVITAADSQLLSYGPRTPANLLALARAIYTDDTSS